MVQKLGIEMILGVCMVNSWVLYNNYGDNKKIDMLKFREKVIEGLLKGDSEENEGSVSSTSSKRK